MKGHARFKDGAWRLIGDAAGEITGRRGRFFDRIVAFEDAFGAVSRPPERL